MLKLMNNQAFASILEVIVSSIIFMTAAVGFFSAVSMLRPQAADSTQKLAALYVGKRVMDDLRSQVYGNLWNHPSSGLRPGVLFTQTIGVYTVNYIVTNVPGMPLRRLDMNIQFPD
jgi:hypothetical protein